MMTILNTKKCWAVLLVLMAGMVLADAAYAQSAKVLAITTDGLQVEFDRNLGRLTSIRLDADGDGQFKNEKQLLYRFSGGQRLTDTDAPAQSPTLVVSRATDQGTWFGVQIDGQSALPAYLTWFVPRDQNLVFFRYNATAIKNCGLQNVELATNLGTDLFTGEKHWLPDGAQRQQSDYTNVGYGFWDTRNDYPEDATGCIFVADGIGLAYRVLNFVGGKTVYSRFTKGPEKAPNNINGRAGWIKPEFDLDREMIPAGTHLSYTCAYQIQKWQGVKPVTDYLTSKTFDQAYAHAEVQLDEAQRALSAMKDQWQAATASWDYQKDLDQLKLDMVHCQVDLHLVREALLDAQIAGELSGHPRDLTQCQKQMQSAEQAYAAMYQQVTPVNEASSRIGARFSQRGNVRDAIDPLKQVYHNANESEQHCRKQIDAVVASLGQLGFAVRPEASEPTAHQRRKSLLSQPLFSACWIAPRSSVFNTVDDYALDLKKLRLLGLNAINTSEHYLYMDTIVRRNRYPEARQSAMHALLDPIGKANLKAVVGMYSLFHNNKNDVIPPQMMGRDMAQRFRSNDTMDYENPQVVAFRERQFSELAAYLKKDFADVVVGFDYDNEYAWNQDFSAFAKPYFVAYLKALHQSIASLNQAWGTQFASWEQFEAQLKIDKSNPLLRENSRDWWAYANSAFAYRHWGSIYRGIKDGWEDAVCVARAPRSIVHSISRDEPGKRVTDVVGGHWQKATEGSPAPVLHALSDGKPIFQTEFWWSFLPDESVAKRFDEKTTTLYNQQIEQYGFDTLSALDGRRQMWEYFMEGCKGFSFFPNPPNKGNMLESNGMANDAAAAMTSTMRQVQALNDVVDQTVLDAKLGVLIRKIEKGPSSVRVGVSTSPMLMLQTLNIPFNMVLEKQVQTGDLSPYTHLWLNDAECLEPATISRLAQWVAMGGTLILSGPAGTVDDYDHPVDAMRELAGVSWSKTPGGKQITISQSGMTVSLADPAQATGSQQTAEGISQYLQNKFSKGSIIYSFESLAKDVKPLAAFETGSPALALRAVGKGSVLSMAAPVEEFLFTAVNLHDPRGETYVRQLIGFLDQVLKLANVDRPFEMDRLGDTQFDQDNIMAFYRRPKDGRGKRYLFLLNTGYAVNGKYGSIHYALTPYTHEPQPAMTQITLSHPYKQIREMLRDVEVKMTRTLKQTSIKVPLHPGQCYAFELME
jgi:hypothetical protein